MQQRTVLALGAGVVLGAGLALALAACTYHINVQVTFPDKPLRVVVVKEGGDTTAVAGDGSTDGGIPPDTTPPMARGTPQRKPIAGGPLAIADAGTLVFVEYAGGSDGSSIRVVEVSGRGAQACADGRDKNELWRLTKNRRWDAQQAVASGKVLCAETADGASGDGDVVWLTR